MTEPDWLAAADPHPMLDALRDHPSGRKSRLLCVACCRRVPQLLAGPTFDRAIDVAERFADGEATPAERKAARTAAHAAVPGAHWSEAAWTAQALLDRKPHWLPFGILPRLHRVAALRAGNDARWAGGTQEPVHAQALAAEKQAQCHLIRDVFGLLTPPAFDPAWRTSTAVALAEAIYAARAFDNMPILADALEDAGCDAADILAHCRGEGPHVRGCWVVDALLSKV